MRLPNIGCGGSSVLSRHFHLHQQACCENAHKGPDSLCARALSKMQKCGKTPKMTLPAQVGADRLALLAKPGPWATDRLALGPVEVVVAVGAFNINIRMRMSAAVTLTCSCGSIIYKYVSAAGQFHLCCLATLPCCFAPVCEIASLTPPCPPAALHLCAQVRRMRAERDEMRRRDARLRGQLANARERLKVLEPFAEQHVSVFSIHAVGITQKLHGLSVCMTGALYKICCNGVYSKFLSSKGTQHRREGRKVAVVFLVLYIWGLVEHGRKT